MAQLMGLLRRCERPVARGACIVLLTMSAWEFLRWQRLEGLSSAVNSGEGIVRYLDEAPETAAYALGWWASERGDWRTAARHFIELETSDDPEVAQRARLALGNVYLDLALRAGTQVAGVARMNQLSRFDLAREAYRSALRRDPAMHAARHNLELLEHSLPERRVRGWQRDTDGVTLQPFKRNGWTGMREKPKRGLP